MDGFFDFLTDNPLALLVIIYFVTRILRGSKKAQATTASVPGEDARSKAPDTKRRQEVERRLAEQLRGLGIDVPTIASPSTATRPTAQRGEVASEFHEPVTVARSRSERLVDSSGDEKFGYHTAVSEPEAVQYHLSGFAEFHEAHGIERTSAGLMEDFDISEPRGTTVPFDPVGVRNGLLLAEILGPPIVLRRRHGGRRVTPW